MQFNISYISTLISGLLRVHFIWADQLSLNMDTGKHVFPSERMRCFSLTNISNQPLSPTFTKTTALYKHAYYNKLCLIKWPSMAHVLDIHKRGFPSRF